MNTLMIKDLSITEELDGRAMSAVRGGYSYGSYCYPSPSYFSFDPVYAPNQGKTVTATQFISSAVNIQNANGNNTALVSGITTTIDPHVSTSNNITVR
ncbi:hypothetical protein A6V36_18825 [Paraburkholderia ginsengiterrae]|uniref:Uncharacterized protein n=1 Tax=Paraburkholderia ginsengiterrae TaxID=1462993 RepID=A0A1A9MXR2_9BURK|nr:hypothetical protein [Paraburkholderia ginsengiterrae]OAJ52171.1 hypothetical protein A6V37_11005 [Paraburkholderia ginsengiterrae]OAJ63536.1 hypothetical protein A6V36_18825 [Paraburkholderia ginsengiterrae]